MKLTIESHYDHLKQTIVFEGDTEEYNKAFGNDADPYTTREAISKSLSKAYMQLTGKTDLSGWRKDDDNEH